MAAVAYMSCAWPFLEANVLTDLVNRQECEQVQQQSVKSILKFIFLTQQASYLTQLVYKATILFEFSELRGQYLVPRCPDKGGLSVLTKTSKLKCPHICYSGKCCCWQSINNNLLIILWMNKRVLKFYQNKLPQLVEGGIRYNNYTSFI